MFRKKRLQEISKEKDLNTITELLDQLSSSRDFVRFQHRNAHFSCWISYFRTLIDGDYVHRDFFPFLYRNTIHSMQDIQAQLPVEQLMVTKDLRVIQSKLLEGYIILQQDKNSPECLIVPSIRVQGRQIEQSEIETSIIGPKETFVESIDTNINLVRKRIPVPQLMLKEIQVGKLSRSRVGVMYIDGIANEENVNTVMQRIRSLEVSSLIDATMLGLMITDNTWSIFPPFTDTERPDRVSGAVYEGKIAVLVDGSPTAMILPSTIVEFFTAFDDYFLPWSIASAYRLLRLAAVFLSVLSTSLYVALLTYHYQLIPKDLLGTLISSRSSVPFDPVVEVLILEVMIELLREAGARLPTKVGQTIGIVGGIVIGTATVQAGLTSNILLIIIAMSALAAFITPNYRMATTIRFIRFPFILCAQIAGLLGIAMCFTYFITHLLRLTSLGRPYFEPIYPFRVSDLKDAFIRLPLHLQTSRPLILRSGDPARMNTMRTRQKKGKQSPDIDE
jgi:hypothetical protein